MKISCQEKNDTVIIKISGNLIEGPTSEQFKDIIGDYLKSNFNKFILDLGKVDYVNSTGLSIIFQSYRTIQKNEGSLVLTNLSKKLKHLLEITRLNSLFIVE